jgi:hypothetical protein
MKKLNLDEKITLKGILGNVELIDCDIDFKPKYVNLYDLDILAISNYFIKRFNKTLSSFLK